MVSKTTVTRGTVTRLAHAAATKDSCHKTVTASGIRDDASQCELLPPAPTNPPSETTPPGLHLMHTDMLQTWFGSRFCAAIILFSDPCPTPQLQYMKHHLIVSVTRCVEVWHHKAYWLSRKWWAGA